MLTRGPRGVCESRPGESKSMQHHLRDVAESTRFQRATSQPLPIPARGTYHSCTDTGAPLAAGGCVFATRCGYLSRGLGLLMSDRSPGKQLREAVADVTIQIPGVFNALVGRLAEDSGFDAVYLSGAALSAGVLALPDVGLFSLTELVTQAAYLTLQPADSGHRRRRHRFRRGGHR